MFRCDGQSCENSRSMHHIDADLVELWYFGVQFRESEGTFQFGHMRREADDLHAVIQHFSGSNHVVSAIFGHSKGG